MLELPGVTQVKVAAVHGRDDLSENDVVELARRHRRRCRAVHVSRRRWLGGEALRRFRRGGRMVLTDPATGRALELRVRPDQVPQVGRLDQLPGMGTAGPHVPTTIWRWSPASERRTASTSRCRTGRRRRPCSRARSASGPSACGCRTRTTDSEAFRRSPRSSAARCPPCGCSPVDRPESADLTAAWTNRTRSRRSFGFGSRIRS